MNANGNMEIVLHDFVSTVVIWMPMRVNYEFELQTAGLDKGDYIFSFISGIESGVDDCCLQSFCAVNNVAIGG